MTQPENSAAAPEKAPLERPVPQERPPQAGPLEQLKQRLFPNGQAPVKLPGGSVPEQLNDSQAYFLNALGAEAARRLKLLDACERESAAAQEDSEPPAPPTADAACFPYVPAGAMEGWLVLFPAMGEGRPFSRELIGPALKEAEIVWGIDEPLLDALSENPLYFTLLVAARGVPAVDGENGEVVDRFSREVSRLPKEKENGQVDYKDLGWMRQVHEGDVICDLLPPKDPVDGTNVRGETLSGKTGWPARPPMGKNTVVNEEGSALVAKVDGQLDFTGGQFNVTQVTTIDENVDVSTGSLDVLGDLIVKGDVSDGYTLKASGNIVVMGMVEAAYLFAGGSIQLKKGMNGNDHGTLHAGGDIFANFLEHCEAQAGGSVHVQSVINSTVISNGEVDVTAGRGVIVGGTIMSAGSVKAKVIGNQTNGKVVITLGTTPAMVEEREKTARELKQVEKQVEETGKNVAYLEKLGSLPPEYQKLKSQLTLQLGVAKMQLAKLQRHLQKLDEKQDVTSCTVESGVIYPLTKISFGQLSQLIVKPVHMCRIYRTKDGVVIGAK